MKDQLISFQTAKLAKEKGFNVPTLYRFQGNHNAGSEYLEIMDEVGEEQVSRSQFGYVIKSINHAGMGYLLPRLNAPTQSLLQKWLREKHNILITIYSNASGYLWEHMDAKGGTHREDSGYSGPNDSGCWDTYEDALEAGLIHILTKRIN